MVHEGVTVTTFLRVVRPVVEFDDGNNVSVE
jgi:hypothetical protein